MDMYTEPTHGTMGRGTQAVHVMSDAILLDVQVPKVGPTIIGFHIGFKVGKFVFRKYNGRSIRKTPQDLQSVAFNFVQTTKNPEKK